MRGREIIKCTADQLGLRRADVSETVNTFLDQIRLALRNGEEAKILGFGTFYVKHCAARHIVNARLGGDIDLPAKDKICFRPAKTFDITTMR